MIARRTITFAITTLYALSDIGCASFSAASAAARARDSSSGPPLSAASASVRSPRDRGDCAHHDARIADSLRARRTVDHDRDADQRPIEALLLARLQIMAAHARGRRRHDHFGNYFAGLQRIFALRIDTRQREELFQLDAALSGRADDRRARAHRNQRGREIRRMHDERRAAAENRVITIQPADRVAGVAALLQAIHVGIAKVPASRTLQNISADRAEVANLRRRRLARRLGNRGELRADRRMLSDFAQLHRRAEAKLAGRTHLDTTELLQPLQIHQRELAIRCFASTDRPHRHRPRTRRCHLRRAVATRSRRRQA